MTFSEKCIIFEKSLGSRGFYIQVSNHSTRNWGNESSLDLKFLAYQDYEIELYDRYWLSHPDNLELKANLVRGAHKLNVTFSPLGKAKNVKLHLFEVKWIMDTK